MRTFNWIIQVNWIKKSIIILKILFNYLTTRFSLLIKFFKLIRHMSLKLIIIMKPLIVSYYYIDEKDLLK